MSRGMGEVLSQMTPSQDLTSCFVHRRGAYSGSNLGDCRLLRFGDSCVHLARIVAETAYVHGACPVRTITGEYNTEIADDESAAGYTGCGSASMNHGGTLAGGDDR